MTVQTTQDNRVYNIYVVISETPTEFGRLIRKFAKLRYNHASIAFEEELRHLYSFGRHQYKNPLNAGIIREYPERFTLCRFSRINVRIYKIPVTKEQYTQGKRRILEIKHDPDGYLYNLLSVISYPFFKGFHTYKAYSCAEFVAHMLRHMDIIRDPSRLSCEYTPEEIGECINDYLFFEGNLLEYWTGAPSVTHDFFGNPGYTRTATTSCLLPLKLLYRKIRFGNKFAAII